MTTQEALSPKAFQAETGVSRETLTRLEAYADLLERWNRKINLVGRGTVADLWRRHILDSAQLLPLLPANPDGNRSRVILDFGSGAGLPGLILGILGAGEVHLVESDQRKATFLREAVRVTGTDAVQVHNCRIEALKPFPSDVITARALAPLPRLLDLAEPFLTPSTRCLFLKGAQAQAEIDSARQDWKISVELHDSCSYSFGAILTIEVRGRATRTS